MDVMGDKDKRKDSVEVIAVAGTPQENYVEEPTFIKEDEGLPASSQADEEHPVSQEDGEKMVSDILAEDESKLYAAIKAAEGEMTKVVAESEDEVTEEEYDTTRLAELVAEGEKNAESMSI